MPVSRTVARPLLASMFVAGGLDAAKHPESKASKAEKVGPPLAHAMHLPEDPITLVRINGVVQVAAGALLAAGRIPRISSAVLAASLVPTTLAGHRFWEEEDTATRAVQRISFMKNLAMLGGLLLAATDTEGRPSLGWRARKAAGRASRKAVEVLPGH